MTRPGGKARDNTHRETNIRAGVCDVKKLVHATPIICDEGAIQHRGIHVQSKPCTWVHRDGDGMAVTQAKFG
jgi:hypothetical protein